MKPLLAEAGALSAPAQPAGLPEPRGPISSRLLAALRQDPAEVTDAAELPGEIDAATEGLDALDDDDLQLALYVCFELSYTGFPGVADAWEWDLAQLAVRAKLERAFLTALTELVPRRQPAPDQVPEQLFEIERSYSGPSLSRYLETRGAQVEFMEFIVHRSAYQLKEADPHSWAIPRISGRAKSALVEIQSDEYGGGRPGRMHSVLFAKTMRGLGLEPRPNLYLDLLPGSTLAAVNLTSSLGLRRSSRGALVGHLAMFEMGSARPSRAYANGLRRLGAGPEITDFFDEHVEADAVHESIAAYDLAGSLARQEPELAADIIFGAEAMLAIEGRAGAHLLSCWEQRATSLLRPLPGPPEFQSPASGAAAG